MAPVFMVRIEPTADASLAAMYARIRLGMAMAAMIKMIATTINSSISENPLCFLLIAVPIAVLIVAPGLATPDFLQISSGGPGRVGRARSQSTQIAQM